MSEIKVVDKLSIFKVGSVQFRHRIRPKKLQILQEMVRRFHEVQSYRLLRRQSQLNLNDVGFSACRTLIYYTVLIDGEIP
jgi:hypothetical protein